MSHIRLSLFFFKKGFSDKHRALFLKHCLFIGHIGDFIIDIPVLFLSFDVAGSPLIPPVIITYDISHIGNLEKLYIAHLSPFFKFFLAV